MAWSEKYNKTDAGKIPRFRYESDRDFSEVWDAVVRGLGPPAISPPMDHAAISTAAEGLGVEIYQRRTSRSPQSAQWCIPAASMDAVVEAIVQTLHRA